MEHPDKVRDIHDRLFQPNDVVIFGDDLNSLGIHKMHFIFISIFYISM